MKWTFRVTYTDYNKGIFEITAETLKQAWQEIIEVVGEAAQEITLV